MHSHGASWCCCIAGELDSPHAKAEAGAEEAATLALSTALLEKHLKSKLALAADHFKSSPSKELDYFQVQPWGWGCTALAAPRTRLTLLSIEALGHAASKTSRAPVMRA